ncbi:MAG: hypothetical protein IBX49_03610 [Gammaproteobacteria bacterium]|nr:hypothetical protein [Gammaproteobacteria bacterium]
MSMLLLPAGLSAMICSLSDPGSRAQQEMANILQRQDQLVSLHLDSFTSMLAERCSLLISLGSAAASRVAAWPGPVLHTMIAHDQFQSLYQDGTRYPRSAVFIDQPLERYVALMSSAMPEHSEVLLLSSENTQTQIEPLVDLLRRRRMALRTVPYAPDDSIDKILADNTGPNSVLLVLPDIRVLNSDTAKTIITASYQRGIPLVGYSEHLVRAGGLMAVYASTTNQLVDVRTAIQLWQETASLPAAAYTRNYSVAINYRLARALQLRLPTEAMVLDAMAVVIDDD